MRTTSVIAGLVLSLALAAQAEDPVTIIGFWTFDGTSGQPISETRTTVTVPNRISGTTPELLVRHAEIDKAQSPIPVYTNDVQYADIYEGDRYDTKLATAGISLYMKGTATPAKLPNAASCPHAYLQITNVGSALTDKSWTLEYLYKSGTRPSGWVPFWSISANSLGKSPINISTDVSTESAQFGFACTIFRASILDGSTEKQVKNSRISSLNSVTGVDDGDWHHVAIRWTESTNTESTNKVEIVTDYATRKTVTLTDNNLLLDEKSYITINACNSSGYNNHDQVYVQAVRLTTGDLPTSRFMRTSAYSSLPTTLAHYRFEGTSGDRFGFTRNEVQPRRSDQSLLTNVASDSGSLVPDYSTYGEPQMPYVQVGTTRPKNETAAWYGSDANPPSRLRCSMSNEAYPVPPHSFTYELFVNFQHDTLTTYSAAHTLILAEKGGPNAQSGNKYNWLLAQASSTTKAGYAKISLNIRILNGTTVADYGMTKVPYSGVPPLLSTNVWHHLAFTYDEPSRTARLYIDHEEFATKTLAEGETLVRGTYVRNPGIQDCNQNYGFAGAIDEYRISTVALEPKDFLKMKRNARLGFAAFFR